MSTHGTSSAKWYCEDCSTVKAPGFRDACPDCCGFRATSTHHCGFGFGVDECHLPNGHNGMHAFLTEVA